MAGEVHYDQTLTDYAVAWEARTVQFIANQAAVPVPVKRRADRYSVYSQADMGRDDMALRAPGAPTVVLTQGASTDTFYCDNYGGKIQVIWQERDNDDDPAAYEQSKVSRLIRAAAIRRERLFAATALLNTSWASTNRMTGTASTQSGLNFTRFSASGSDPVLTIHTAHDLIRAGTAGEKGNVLVMTPDVYHALKSNAAIIDRIKYTGTGSSPSSVTPNALAQLFDVDQVLIPYSNYTSSVEGATLATANTAGVNQMVLMYQSPEKFSPTALRQFVWSPYDDAGNDSRVSVRRWDDQAVESTWLEAQVCLDFKVVANAAAVHFATTLTS
jgi:hypothetical protein